MVLAARVPVAMREHARIGRHVEVACLGVGQARKACARRAQAYKRLQCDRPLKRGAVIRTGWNRHAVVSEYHPLNGADPRVDLLHIMKIRLVQDFPGQINACLDVLTEQEIWWRPNEQANSPANLVLHLAASNRYYVEADHRRPRGRA